MQTYLIDEGLRENAVRMSEVLDGDPKPELIGVVSSVAARYDVSFAAVTIISKNKQILLARIGTEVSETPRDASFCQYTIQQPGKPLVVRDAWLDPRFAELATVTQEPFLRFYAGVPITDGAGYPLGALCIADQTPRLEAPDLTALIQGAAEVSQLLRWW